MMNNYKAVIVDDEIDNIAILEHFVKKYCPLVTITGSATTVAEAIAVIDQTRPDILFMDIRLNEGDAFVVLDHLIYLNAQVIFVTSYNEYAIKAFKYNAIDYILKPIAIEELVFSVNKAIKNIEQQQPFDLHKLASFITAQQSEHNASNYLAIPSIDKIDMIRISEIVYIEADGKYTYFRTVDGKKYTSNRHLLYFEQLIDKRHFYRIHKSYIINMDHVIRVLKTDGHYCEMDTGILLPISKRKLDDFNRFIKIKE